MWSIIHLGGDPSTPFTVYMQRPKSSCPELCWHNLGKQTDLICTVIYLLHTVLPSYTRFWAECNFPGSGSLNLPLPYQIKNCDYVGSRPQPFSLGGLRSNEGRGACVFKCAPLPISSAEQGETRVWAGGWGPLLEEIIDKGSSRSHSAYKTVPCILVESNEFNPNYVWDQVPSQ